MSGQQELNEQFTAALATLTKHMGEHLEFTKQRIASENVVDIRNDLLIQAIINALRFADPESQGRIQRFLDEVLATHGDDDLFREAIKGANEIVK